VQIERLRATYKTDTSGAADAGWLDTMRSTIARRIVRRTKARLARDFAGHKYLALERTIGSGSRKVATNASLKGAVVAEGAQMFADGLIEDMAAFKAGVTVEQDSTDNNRANIYVPVNPANQLQIIAVAARMGA
jgi:phage tail sheath gpL-like